MAIFFGLRMGKKRKKRGALMWRHRWRSREGEGENEQVNGRLICLPYWSENALEKRREGGGCVSTSARKHRQSFFRPPSRRQGGKERRSSGTSLNRKKKGEHRSSVLRLHGSQSWSSTRDRKGKQRERRKKGSVCPPLCRGREKAGQRSRGCLLSYLFF